LAKEKGMPERDIKTETFQLGNIVQRFFRGDHLLECLVPSVIDHYLEGEEQRVQEKLGLRCHRPNLYQQLRTLILDLNSEISRDGVIPQSMSAITIPTSISFFRYAFPTFNIIESRQGQVRIDPNIGVLNRLDFLDELEIIVRRNMTIDFMHLSTDPRRRIVEALHTFRIYTAASIHSPHPQGTPNDNLVEVSEAIRVFQHEYMGYNAENRTGSLDRYTLLLINQALTERWQRSPFYERVNPVTNARRYFIRLGVRPIIARFNQQGTANPVHGTVDGPWGGDEVFIPGLGQTVRHSGCAIVLVANIAFTHGSRTIDPLTIRNNDDNFTAGGGLIWSNPLRASWPSFSDPEMGSSQLTAAKFNRFMNNASSQVYVGINVNHLGPTGSDSVLPHWVGASELVTINVNVTDPETGAITPTPTQFFRISPTSSDDLIMGTSTSVNGNNRSGRGWRAVTNENGQSIYVPLSQVRGYRIFTIP